MNVLADSLVKAVADEEVDRCLVIDALWKDTAALSSDPALSTNSHPIADPKIATNLDRHNKTSGNLVYTAAVDAGLAISGKDVDLPLGKRCPISRWSRTRSSIVHAPTVYLH